MKPLKIAGSVVALLALARLAQAYVPPSFFVIRMLSHKHAGIENERFRSKITFYRKGGDAVVSINETLIITNAERATIHLTDASGGELATRARKLSGGRVGELERPALYDLLFIRDSSSIHEHLKTLGLPLRTEAALYADKEENLPYKPEDTVSFQRLDHKTAIVVGNAKPGDKNDPPVSLWVEKDSFLPLRAVFPSSPEAGMASEPLDFRFSGYQVYRDFLYPRTVEVFRNGALWAKIETQDVRAGSTGSLEEPKNRTDVDGDLKEYVDTYLRWVR